MTPIDVDVDAVTANPPSEGSHMFRPQNWLDRVFEIGIIGKGLNGALEIVGGLLLLFLTPARIHHVLAALTQGELSEDPGDFIATRLLHTANGLTGSAVLFGAAYLLIHGLVKVALVTALLANKLWAYPWTIAVLLLFISYQLYRIALSPTAELIALTLFDAVIVALTWREYRQQRGSAPRRQQPRQPLPLTAAQVHVTPSKSARGELLLTNTATPPDTSPPVSPPRAVVHEHEMPSTPRRIGVGARVCRRESGR